MSTTPPPSNPSPAAPRPGAGQPPPRFVRPGAVGQPSPQQPHAPAGFPPQYSPRPAAPVQPGAPLSAQQQQAQAAYYAQQQAQAAAYAAAQQQAQAAAYYAAVQQQQQYAQAAAAAAQQQQWQPQQPPAGYPQPAGAYPPPGYPQPPYPQQPYPPQQPLIGVPGQAGFAQQGAQPHRQAPLTEAQRLRIAQKKQKIITLICTIAAVLLVFLGCAYFLYSKGARIQDGQKMVCALTVVHKHDTDRQYKHEADCYFDKSDRKGTSKDCLKKYVEKNGEKYRARKAEGTGGFAGADYTYIVDEKANPDAKYREYFEVHIKRYFWTFWMPDSSVLEVNAKNEKALEELASTRAWQIEK